MPTFTFNPSPPSTPGSGQQSTSSLNFGKHPSTTQLGPPPSTTKSFTPAGAPPSSFFGSSQLGSGQSLFSAKPKSKAIETSKTDNGQPIASRVLETKFTTKIPLNDVAQAEDDHEADADGEEDDMELDFDNGDQSREPRKIPSQVNFNSSGLYDWAAHGSSVRLEKSSENYATLGAEVRTSLAGLTPARSTASLIQAGDFALSTIAKDIAKRDGRAEFTEPDKLILETEAQVLRFYDDTVSAERYNEYLQTSLAAVPGALSKVWQSCADELPHSNDEERGDTIGPLDDDPALYKASYLGGLLLLLHHPPLRHGEPAVPRTGRKLQSTSFAHGISSQEAYPKALVDWLDANHNPYRGVLLKFLSKQPNPTVSRDYWDILLSTAMRGQLGAVRKILEVSDFQYARTVEDDGLTTRSYLPSHLEAIQYVIGQAVKTLDQCPALQDGNWHITGPDWALFRRIVEESIHKLSSFAEGENRGHLGQSTFEEENFGRSSISALGQSTRAQSRVPWSIYNNLKRLYYILQGKSTEIINLAQDWLEGSLALAIWWDGNDEEFGRVSKSSFRQSRRSHVHPQRLVDKSPVSAYRKRVMQAFEVVTAEDALRIETNSTMELAISLVIDGYIQDSLSLLRTWSIPITAALMEIGTEAGWYESQPEAPGVDGLDESDLMVLSYAQPEKPISKDSVLMEYAEMVSEKPRLRSGRKEMEGWEISIELLGRVENQQLSTKEVARYLKRVDVQSDEKAEKLISIYREYDLHKEASEIAEVNLDINQIFGCWLTALEIW